MSCLYSEKSTPASKRTLSLLDSVPEYRTLKRDLEREQRKCSAWTEDYRRLNNEFDKYRQESFRNYVSIFSYHFLIIYFLVARPTTDGLNFLLQLVENLTSSSTASDTRTNKEVAVSLGLREEKMMQCCHLNPQRAALLLFSSLYPTHQDRAKLVNIKKFSKDNSKILENMFGMLFC